MSSLEYVVLTQRVSTIRDHSPVRAYKCSCLPGGLVLAVRGVANTLDSSATPFGPYCAPVFQVVNESVPCGAAHAATQLVIFLTLLTYLVLLTTWCFFTFCV